MYDIKGTCLVLRKRHRDIFGKNWKMRWVVVSGERVGVFKKEGSTEPKYWLHLLNCEVIEEEVVNKRYKVICPLAETHLSSASQWK